MITVLAVDALESTLVEGFGMEGLMQKHHGRTDISEFSAPRTMVLWSSFLCGRNMEAEVTGTGKDAMWSYSVDRTDTFLSDIDDAFVLDLPGYNYDNKQHSRERSLLKDFFDAAENNEKENIRRKYNELAFLHHREIKSSFLEELEAGHDLLIGYFSAADVIGHLNFGDRALMRMIYRDMDILARMAAGLSKHTIVLSDHGMTSVGMFGDHSNYGFWSTDFKDLGKPKITDFAGIINGLIH